MKTVNDGNVEFSETYLTRRQRCECTQKQSVIRLKSYLCLLKNMLFQKYTAKSAYLRFFLKLTAFLPLNSLSD